MLNHDHLEIDLILDKLFNKVTTLDQTMEDGEYICNTMVTLFSTNIRETEEDLFGSPTLTEKEQDHTE
jgi:hypothetical protein